MRLIVLTRDLEALKQEQCAHAGDWHAAEVEPGLWVVSVQPLFPEAAAHLEAKGHFPLPHLLDEAPVRDELLALLPAKVGHKKGDTSLTLARKLHAHTQFRGVLPHLY